MRPANRGTAGKQRAGGLPLVRTASAGGNLAQMLRPRTSPQVQTRDHGCLAHPSQMHRRLQRRESSVDMMRDLQPSQSAVSSRSRAFGSQRLNNLRRSMHCKTAQDFRTSMEMSPEMLAPTPTVSSSCQRRSPSLTEPCTEKSKDALRSARPSLQLSALHASEAKRENSQGSHLWKKDKCDSRNEEGGTSKPTEEMRQASRSRNSHSKTKHTLSFGQRVGKALPPPDKEQAGHLFPSVQEALDRYYCDFTTVEEVSRRRLVFARFCSDEGSEIVRDILHEALLHLGFFTVTEEEADEIAKQTTDFSTLDLKDFLDFCERWNMHERKALQQRCEAWFRRSQRTDVFNAPVDELQGFMRSLDVVCSKESVQDLMLLGGLDSCDCNSPEDLIRFLAAYRAREGFTLTELQLLQVAFDECEADPFLNKGVESRLIKAREISNGLLSWAGLYCAEHLRQLLSAMEESMKFETPPGCAFHEFVACARRLRERMLYDVFDEFHKLDTDEDGFVGAEDLRPLCKPLGFNLVDAEFDEFLEKENITDDAWLNFEACWKFILCVREADGFTTVERDELTSTFGCFCDESGEVTNAGVVDLLNYIGFDNTLEEVMAMAKQTDFNDNGLMDSGEFMRLMRIQRELSLVSYQAAYNKYGFGEPGTATDSEIAAALAECRIPPESTIVEEEIRPWLEHYEAEVKGLTFESFLHVAETCRRLYPRERRKRAQFKEEEMALITEAFTRQDTSQRGYISLGDLIWLLGDSGLPVHTRSGRAMVYELLDKARASARLAGASEAEVGRPGSPRVQLVSVVFLVREIVRESNRESLEKEASAVKEAKFSTYEIAAFRKLFDSMADAPPDAVSITSERRRDSTAKVDRDEIIALGRPTLSKVIKQFQHVPRCAVSDVVSMAHTSAFNVSAREKQRLSEHIMNLVDDDRGLDFGSFVNIMHWMLDSNYGKVKDSDVEAAGMGTPEGIGPLQHMQNAVNVRRRLGDRRISV